MTRIETALLNNQIASLLDLVKRGERILLTEGGRPVGMLVPSEPEPHVSDSEVANELLEWRRSSGPTLGPDLTVRQLLDEGRRF